MTNTTQNLNLAYGYLWWLNGKASGMGPGFQIVFPGTLMSNAPNDMYAALGKNDQKIYVVPSQNLVVVRQGNTAGGFNLAASAFDNVLWDYINKLDCSVTTISDNENKFYALYPNPVNTILNIDNTNSTLNKISVYDIYGKLMDHCKQNTTTIFIDFTKFEKGFYVIELHNKNMEVIRRKVLKE
jgi:hypothetical protein